MHLSIAGLTAHGGLESKKVGMPYRKASNRMMVSKCSRVVNSLATGLKFAGTVIKFAFREVNEIQIKSTIKLSLNYRGQYGKCTNMQSKCECPV